MGTMGRFRQETRYSRGSCRRTCNHGEKRRCLRRRTEARSDARLQELPRGLLLGENQGILRPDDRRTSIASLLIRPAAVLHGKPSRFPPHALTAAAPPL